VAAAHDLDAPGTDTEMVGNEFAEANVALLGDRGGNDSDDETAIAPYAHLARRVRGITRTSRPSSADPSGY
jgi:hypothetical protein